MTTPAMLRIVLSPTKLTHSRAPERLTLADAEQYRSGVAKDATSAGSGPLDPHRLAEERSLAYHRVIAERIRLDPSLLERARARVQSWLSSIHPVPDYAREWERVLSRSPDEVLDFLVEPGELARELRQSTPFAGVLPPRERWRIWREVRERVTGAA